jgi:sodium/potassium-transporting ATPase subunit alpha
VASVIILLCDVLTSSQSNNDEEETSTFSMEAPGMREMVDIAALNSRVKFDKTDVPFDNRIIIGDATETGLTRFAGRYLTQYDEHLKSFRKVFEVPFNSLNKWALVIVRSNLVFATADAKIRSLAQETSR